MTCLLVRLSWLDWVLTVIGVQVNRVFSDPRGILFNILLFASAAVLLGLTSLACLLASFLLRLFSGSESRMPSHF